MFGFTLLWKDRLSVGILKGLAVDRGDMQLGLILSPRTLVRFVKDSAHLASTAVQTPSLVF